MSRIISRLSWAQGRRKKPAGPISPLFRASQQEFRNLREALTEYHLGVTLYARAFLTDEAAHHACGNTSGLLSNIQKQMRRQIIEEIFGEFREPLMELQRTLWDCDLEAARHQVTALYDQMFSEEEEKEHSCA